MQEDTFMASKVVEPQHRYRGSNTAKRLIDFDAGSADLKNEHKTWLRQAIATLPKPTGTPGTRWRFTIMVLGFASKLGDETKNFNLSQDRVNSVIDFMGKIDPRVWEIGNTHPKYVGEGEAKGGENSDAAEDRAVEVHIFQQGCENVGICKAPPPKWKPIPIKHHRISRPGGPGTTNWSISCNGGAGLALGIALNFTIFYIRNNRHPEERAYFAPGVGVGGSIDLKIVGKGLSALKKAIVDQLADYLPSLTSDDIVTVLLDKGVRPNYILVGRPDDPTIPVKADPRVPIRMSTPCTWSEMEQSLVRILSAVAGMGGKGIQFDTNLYVKGTGGTYHRENRMLFQILASSFGLEAGATMTGGGLIRIDR